MHMADALLSPAVGGAMCVVSTGAIAYAARQLKQDKKLPMMAVAGAFVFAAQMINFTIPGTGSSGHIGGGMLLSALLGGTPALLTISVVLIIQCLFFADGGLLALGCNIFNMGVLPCLLIYPLLFRPLLQRTINAKRITIASVLSVVAALQLGAFCVVLQTTASGITALPFTTFALLMQPIHLAIGVVEGLVTAAILCFVHQMRPEILENTEKGAARKVVAVLLLLTVLTAGGLSLLASENPDGLEWSMEKTAGTTELETQGAVQETAAAIQEHTAFLPGYTYPGAQAIGTSIAGLTGTAITLVLVGATGFVIAKVKKKAAEK